MVDVIVDPELIADCSHEVATLSLEMTRRPPSQILGQISGHWRQDRRNAHGGDRELASSTLMAIPGDGALYVTLLLAARHLARILRHSISVAEQSAAAAPLAQAG
jgi:hypothetical protein